MLPQLLSLSSIDFASNLLTQNLFCSASQDGKLIIWDALSGSKRCVVPLHSAWIMTCAFEPTKGNVVACGGLDNACSVYKLKNEPVHSGVPDVELHGHDGYVSCCRFLTEHKIVSSSGDGSCIVWDLHHKRPETRLSEHQSDVMSIGPCALVPVQVLCLYFVTTHHALEKKSRKRSNFWSCGKLCTQIFLQLIQTCLCLDRATQWLWCGTCGSLCRRSSLEKTSTVTKVT